ncbi:MAG: hypothetical protein R2725_16575 [Solirubrobacterales bacterium]
MLAVDVDGVVSLFGFDDPPSGPTVEFHLVGETVCCLSVSGGRRLRRLSDYYEIVWASGWEGRTRALAPLLGLPEFPFLRFGGAAEFGSADWKLGPIGSYAAGRPLAWIDDSFDEHCYEWARERAEPTLLVDVDSHAGLLDVHVEALIGWARSLRTDDEERGAGGTA